MEAPGVVCLTLYTAEAGSLQRWLLEMHCTRCRTSHASALRVLEELDGEQLRSAGKTVTQ